MFEITAGSCVVMSSELAAGFSHKTMPATVGLSAAEIEAAAATWPYEPARSAVCYIALRPLMAGFLHLSQSES
jgi:hypothetical protein